MKNKGQIQTIEALISIAIIGIITMLLFSREPKSVETTQLSKKIEVYETIKIIDLTQNLRILASNGNSNKIEELLYPYIKSNFKVAIFNMSSNITEVPIIEAKNIFTVSYLISGYPGKFTPIEIRVYLW
ncbi:MAG: hypothetical protein QXY70_03135 [Nanopusillaceae archaeon]